MTARRFLLLCLCALPLTAGQASKHIQSQCPVDMYLPPIPGTLQSTAQEIALIPAATTTFRVRYGTNPGALTSYSPDANGTSITADTRGEFALSGLPSDTKIYYRTECKVGDYWRPGWDGSFVTLPSSGGEIRLGVTSDWHYPPMVMASASHPESDPSEEIKASLAATFLLAREQNLHGWLDAGDGFHLHCANNCLVGDDDFGRDLSSKSISEWATSEATEEAFGAARYSLVLRRLWTYLRFSASSWAIGNHEGATAYGSSYGNGGHWQYRARPWVTTGTQFTLGLGGDLEENGAITSASHGFSDGDGPYRIATAVAGQEITQPILSGCGTHSSSDGAYEYYIRTISDPDRFKIAYGPDQGPCNFVMIGQYGSGEATLLRGSDAKAAAKAVREKYLHNDNDVYPHGLSGVDEDGTIAAIPLSDYAVLLKLNAYEFTDGAAPSSPERWPVDNRSGGSAGGWTYGATQQAWAEDLIDDLGVVGEGYPDVETLLVLVHGTLGGFGMGSAYPYMRSSICDVDTRCVSGGQACEDDADCTSPDTCELPDCSEPFAHPEWQALHAKMASFVTRTDGIAIVLLGHDHYVAGGRKDGVYYYHLGQPGNDSLPNWITYDDTLARMDYDGDTVPAFYEQDFPVEWGTVDWGYTKLRLLPAAESPSGKTQIVLDFIRNGRPGNEAHHGQSSSGFPVTILGQ